MKNLLFLLLFILPITAQAPLKVAITIEISGSQQEQDDNYQRYALTYGWKAKVLNDGSKEVDNPESAKEFTIRHLEGHFAEVINSKEAITRADAAKKTVSDSPLVEPTASPKPIPKGLRK